MSKLYFARFTITSGLEYPDKFNFLLEGLKNEAKTTHRNYIYRFFDTEVFLVEDKEYIAGQLVKYNPEGKEEVVNDSTKKISSENLKNKVEGKAKFILDPHHSLLLFFDVPNIITYEGFITKFCKLFEINYNNFFVQMNISPIKEQYSFLERAKSFKGIRKIVITLYPSNPSNAELWRSVDERLRDNNITKYKEIQENSKPGSKINIDEETNKKIIMSEDGYGVSTVSGTDENGNERTISTKDSLKIIYKNIPRNAQGHFPGIFMSVLDVIEEILNRTKN